MRDRAQAGWHANAQVDHWAVEALQFEQRAALEASGGVPIGIGAGSHLKNVIVDKNARIGKNVTITNAAGVQDASCEEDGYFIRGGIVVVLRNGTIPDGTVI